jgi:hypothetical protein
MTSPFMLHAEPAPYQPVCAARGKQLRSAVCDGRVQEFVVSPQNSGDSTEFGGGHLLQVESAMGPALQAAFLVMQDYGGKLLLFQNAVPSLGAPARPHYTLALSCFLSQSCACCAKVERTCPLFEGAGTAHEDSFA